MVRPIFLFALIRKSLCTTLVDKKNHSNIMLYLLNLPSVDKTFGAPTAAAEFLPSTKPEIMGPETL